jgi:formyltetrahydrofolate hydrolase
MLGEILWLSLGKPMKILSKIARKHLIKMLNIHEHPPFLDSFPGVLPWVFHKCLAYKVGVVSAHEYCSYTCHKP